MTRIALILLALIACVAPAAQGMQSEGSLLETGLGVSSVRSPAVEAAASIREAQGAAGIPASFSDGLRLPTLDEFTGDGEEEESSDPRRLGTAIEIAIVLTLLSLLPAALISVTSFTRIVIVLSFVRRALSVNELPPNPVLIGLALFLTMFVMAPVAERVHEGAWVPYQEGELSAADAAEIAWTELRTFLLANTRESEIQLFVDMAKFEVQAAPNSGDAPEDSLRNEELPLRVVVPAFVLSELKTAFQMGFLLFLPFLVIDLIISSILLSMGMFMLPPVMISTPFKILIFVLVDGWHLVCQSVVTSFAMT